MTATANPIVKFQAFFDAMYPVGRAPIRFDFLLDHEFEQGKRETQHFAGVLPPWCAEMTEAHLSSYIDDMILMSRQRKDDPYFPDAIPDFKDRLLQAVKELKDGE